ncbi:hypothetical protein [Microbacterium candidum]|uniref:Uncharacterized protein n=1 Tax=Microbacterium candidum TaxID=3041922 RepID=A0ABT7MWN7_9MICO|nr:hypothetical protein [Microbacterium sp. ASV49]MDL9978840.1 hypothetical protein [Microbacterium sp. ASV49]
MSLIRDGFAAWRECRADYELALYAQYIRAEAATNGAMLNERGRARGIDPLSLFMGNATRANAYASEELREHWASDPRVTFAAFERSWSAEPVYADEWNGEACTCGGRGRPCFTCSTAGDWATV